MSTDAPDQQSAPAGEQRTRRRLELASTLLLALATVCTAWAGYQSSRWHGEQAKAQAAATGARVDGTRLSGDANRKVQIDVALFIQWVDARGQGDADLARFYRERFTDRFKPAFAAWTATRPLTNADAPRTPFDMRQYVIPETRQVERLEAAAEVSAAKARANIQRADNYVLCVVLLASALFFAGLSTRLRSIRSEAAILGLGWLLLLGTVVWMATFPTTIAV